MCETNVFSTKIFIVNSHRDVNAFPRVLGILIHHGVSLGALPRFTGVISVALLRMPLTIQEV